MAELLQNVLMKHFEGGPDPLPEKKKIDTPPLAATPKSPGNVPGASDTTMGAGAADEKRRILRSLPKKTENTFAGNTGEMAPVKKRVLGGATGGRQTLGE